MKSLFVFAFLALIGCADPSNSDSLLETGFGVYGGNKITDQPFAKSIVGIIDTNTGAICPGTIIANDLVLTAAHCIQGDGTSMEIHFETMVEPYGNRTARVLKGIPHEKYRASLLLGNWNDIGLLHFESHLLPHDYKPMRVMTNPQILRDGASVIGAGYGVKDPQTESGSGVLRWLKTTILDRTYSRTEISIDQSFEKGLCFGDSGGPTIIKNKSGEDLLLGVTSRVLGYAFQKCAIRAVVTRVDQHLPWIRKKAQALRTQGQ